MAAQRRRSPADVTGTKRDQLAKEHAAELERRQSELGMATAQAQADEGVVDASGAFPSPEAAAWRDEQGRNLPRGATKQPGMANVTVDATGFMTDTTQPGMKVKTNAPTPTGTGTETPSAVPGGTIADQQVRPTVDTRNATNVGAVGGGADVEAPRVWTAVGDVRAREAEGGTVEIRVNTDLEEVTIGAGTNFSFKEGQRYKVPQHVYDHLEEKGYVWH